MAINTIDRMLMDDFYKRYTESKTTALWVRQKLASGLSLESLETRMDRVAKGALMSLKCIALIQQDGDVSTTKQRVQEIRHIMFRVKDVLRYHSKPDSLQSIKDVLKEIQGMEEVYGLYESVRDLHRIIPALGDRMVTPEGVTYTNIANLSKAQVTVVKNKLDELDNRRKQLSISQLDRAGFSEFQERNPGLFTANINIVRAALTNREEALQREAGSLATDIGEFKKTNTRTTWRGEKIRPEGVDTDGLNQVKTLCTDLDTATRTRDTRLNLLTVATKARTDAVAELNRVTTFLNNLPQNDIRRTDAINLMQAKADLVDLAVQERDTAQERFDTAEGLYQIALNATILSPADGGPANGHGTLPAHLAPAMRFHQQTLALKKRLDTVGSYYFDQSDVDKQATERELDFIETNGSCISKVEQKKVSKKPNLQASAMSSASRGAPSRFGVWATARGVRAAWEWGAPQLTAAIGEGNVKRAIDGLTALLTTNGALGAIGALVSGPETIIMVANEVFFHREEWIDWWNS